MLGKFNKGIIFLLIFSALSLTGFACDEGEPIFKPEFLNILYDYSLEEPINKLVAEFNRTHNNLKLYAKPYASREIAYIMLEAKDKVDMVFVADSQVFKDLLMPKEVSWYASFGENELVLAFSQKSKYYDKININNWHEILVKPEVNLARPEENLSCLGYRNLMLFELAAQYLGIGNLAKSLEEKSAKFTSYSEGQIPSLLKTEVVDYAFIYLNVAKSNNLKILRLPEEINLSKVSLAEHYQQVSLRLTGRNRRKFLNLSAEPIRYAFTVPAMANFNLRWPYILEIFKLMFSESGKEIFKDSGLSLEEIKTFKLKEVPGKLKPYVNLSD